MTSYSNVPLTDFTSNLDVVKVVELVRIAETAERYDDMCLLVTQMAILKCSANETLNVDERNLLSVAYKNVVGTKRAAWRTLNGDFDNVDQSVIDKYKILVEDELENSCLQIINLLVEKLALSVKGANNESEVFYLKMAGDYYRYLAEFRADDKYKNNSRKYYEQALVISEQYLPETHPTRLGLALNFSVCYYEIFRLPDKACELAKKSFDCAIEKLDALSESSYKDSTLIMQLLRDNLALWTPTADDN